ncbi:MAG: hypothetical protein EWV53_06320 [Microcystis panniformis Mp_MB_F_20051200_S9]|uniref:Uncharacterized protein n=1 Tax=Microcystis panniformis Mp_MB_F_20051200_S9 TaxID=2486223 RepID=A0A552Q5H4_9CHRO|nr:MAG: hypothetical protein EWV87_14470 [Microcystis panniformis Mp_GB_SS_20050300_S99]TRV47654.1 MAG: hypothetical protein EWV43_12045 [Microcystis panniformis Mp_MB_F_20080800_S26D]TRV52335.1 MAG: hypothetical protein EWV42_08040 [Microcystis panniformis Mp_GB_SS_20050300_S99D]TRV56478.1 MAG: hypothetical protein EWV69_17780 [Microcystis panniformis Mp_MB_F_20080800_S26]TRV56876.1 MAG: hypothetical protein EWV86_21805 [Microcystis panniformis Mp_MB_F_20051200_S9D]TRV64476.1 MAG: hypothetica
MESSPLPIHNPAERLLIILQRCSQDETNESVQTVLSRVMEVKNDPDSFYQGFGKLLELISNIEDQLQYFSSRKQSSYKKLMEEIKYELISLLRNLEWSWLSSGGPPISPDWYALHWLPSCVEDFEEIYLSQEDLNRLREEILGLIQMIKDSKITQEFKQFLLIKLNEVLESLNKFYIVGYNGLRKEILATLAEVGINQVEGEDKETKNNISQKLWEFLTKIVPEKAQKINPLISLPVNVYKLAEMFTNNNFLPPGN